MTRRFLIGVLVVALAGFADHKMDAPAVASSAEMKTQVFRYLDSTELQENHYQGSAIPSDVPQSERPLAV